MKKQITIIAAIFALAGAAHAGGIQGRVVDSNGYARSNVKISVSGHRQTTTTDSRGYYTLKLPSYADNTRVNVYVNGKLAVNCLVPAGEANSTVDVTLIRK
jgi:hypothetical protein